MTRLLALLLVVGAVACSRPQAEETAPSSFTQGAVAEGPFDTCVRELMAGEEQSVKRRIERSYRLSSEDAHDLVRDALINVCLRHAERRYERLGAAFATAADNRARDDWRHRRRYPRCPFDSQMPACSPSWDESVRFGQEDRVVEVALCKEDRISERIIRQRVVEELDFATIGRDFGLTADQTRTMFHNAIRRVQQRVSDACRS